MALYDKAKNWWDNLDVGNDLLGVGLSDKDQLMLEGGLLKKEDVKRAKEKSLTQGLLSAGLAYAIQPKNKGYGSAIPYLAQAAKAGLTGARAPYEGLGETAKLREQIKQYKINEASKLAKKGIFTDIPSQTVTGNRMTNTVPTERMMPDGTMAPMPNFGEKDSYSYNLPGKRVIDYNKLKNFALEYPEQGAPLMDIMKTDSDINKNNAPDAEALSSLGKNWNKMVNEGTTGRFKTFAEYVDANPTVPYPEKKLSETQNKTVEGYFTAASAAQVVAGRINQINALIGEKKPGGGLVQLGATLQAYLGLDTPAADVDQVVKAIQTRGATLVRAPGSGSTSDLEFGAYKAVFPTLATTTDGRELMVKMANASARRTARIADYAQKLYGEGTFSLEKIYDYDKSLGRVLNDEIRQKAEELAGVKVIPYSEVRKEADKLFDLIP